jgi:hypothetical protein
MQAYEEEEEKEEEEIGLNYFMIHHVPQVKHCKLHRQIKAGL